jgi:alkylhydroperoxidase family enzyme
VPLPPPLPPAPLPWIERLPAPQAAPLRQALDLHGKLLEARKQGKAADVKAHEGALARALQTVLTQGRENRDKTGLPALAGAHVFLAVAPVPVPRCPPSDPCAGLDAEAPPPRSGVLGVLDDAQRNARALLDVAATAPEGSLANTHGRFLRLALQRGTLAPGASQELGALARQLAGPSRTWAQWLQIEAASRGPEDLYSGLLEEISREPGAMRVLALDELARIHGRGKRFREALRHQLNALDIWDQSKNDEGPRPPLKPAELGDRAATFVLRLSESAPQTAPLGQQIFAPLLTPDFKGLRGAPWGATLGAVVRQALGRNDVASARQAAMALLGRAPDSIEAPMALQVQLRAAQEQGDAGGIQQFTAMTRRYKKDAPWAAALRQGRGQDGQPDEEALQAALAPPPWPAPPQASETPWEAARSQLRALVEHCAAVSSDKGARPLVLRLQQTGSEGLTLAAEGAADEGLNACLQRNGYAFLASLPNGEWALRLRARLPATP